MVGTARFELTTPCTQNRCATRLRHVPIHAVHYPAHSGLKTPLAAGGRGICPFGFRQGRAAQQGQAAGPPAKAGWRIWLPGTIPSDFASPPLISSTARMPSPPSIGVRSPGFAR